MPETPMLKQYNDIKKKHEDAILFFRLGDFYEMFGPDAIEASKILNITLTARNKGTDNETPMCGVPYHALDGYLSKLTKAGKKVAICEQLSDPSLPGIVKRQVVRIVTPGTTLDNNILDNKSNNYLVALVYSARKWGLAICDLTTGEFKVGEFDDSDLVENELFRLSPSEAIVSPSVYNNSDHQRLISKLKTVNPFQIPNYEDPAEFLKKHFKIQSLDSFGIGFLKVGVAAAANLLGYLIETQKTNLEHITKITLYNFKDRMVLDEATIRNLEIFGRAVDFEQGGDLLSVIDRTQTAMGGRMLRSWLRYPLLKKNEIERRHFSVEEMVKDISKQKRLAETLKNVADIERLLGRIGCRRATARDLVALKNSLRQIPKLKQSLADCKSELLSEIYENASEHTDLVLFLDKVFIEEPPAIITEGGMIKEGFNKELDELRSISTNAKDWIGRLQQKEAEKTGIRTLKIKYNHVFGYFIEVSKANQASVPDDYIRKQTLVNSERYITPELKEYEEKVLGAEEKIKKMEYDIFLEARDEAIKYFSEIQKTAVCVAVLDVLLGLAVLAAAENYVRPEMSSKKFIEIKNGRHPVIEKFVSDAFVPNDVFLDHETHEFILLTGPNMSGKSSFLRQTALIVLLAQIGSFVPAESATIGAVDRIFTRVGAADNLVRGRSTFMVEMEEAANILNNATKNSLIILDELGRGTSTYDGVGIAWAIVEYIHNNVGAFTLFATHYHELIELVEGLKKAQNYSVAVTEDNGRVIFLRKVLKGGVNKSYGIEVAKLAGLPVEITDRANEVLHKLEKDREVDVASNAAQGELFNSTAVESKIEKEIKEIDLDNLTPIEALQVLVELKKKLK
ncbi:MAG TPA: DNA mismatch repair protein MutS [Candidatus Bipolaricaulota bacterium]|nr:DNA mismatch repair protein MutS [Candidatus Bipolaricaulota bacterium]